MSKRKKSPVPKKKKKSLKPMIITAAVIAAVAAATVVAYIIYYNNSLESTGFTEKTFTCRSACDASGDEVQLADVYNVHYDTYQGTMTLKNDGSFTFWMTPGSADDGVHGGKYTYDREKNIINAKFGNGEKVKFKVVRNPDNSVKRIEVPYQGYTVYMSAE